MADELKVFISWSGDLSKQVAIELKGLLPVIFDRVSPWVSDRDIEAGGRSMQEISQELDETSFGIVVVTRSNQTSQWLNFEAGALSKRFSKDDSARVVPLLVDFEAIAELTGPLTQFQAKLLNETGVRDVLTAVGGALEVGSEVVTRRMQGEWQGFRDRVSALVASHGTESAQPRRDSASMIEETLELVRTLVIHQDFAPRPPQSWSPKRQQRLSEALGEELSVRGVSSWTMGNSPFEVRIDITDHSIPRKTDVQLAIFKSLEAVLRNHDHSGPLLLSINGEDVPPF